MGKSFIPLTVRRIQDETADAYTLFFEKPEDERFVYQAGQYLTLKVDIEGKSHRRAYSLSSSPLVDEFLSVTVKRVKNGLMSHFLRDHLSVGDTVMSMPPMGNFSLTTHPENTLCYVLIGGGSGITPLISILKTVLYAEPDSVVHLWYGNRDEESIIFKQELEKWENQFPDRLVVHHQLSQPSAAWEGPIGRFDKTAIYDKVSRLFMTDEHRKRYFLCGPHGLITAAEAALDKHAVHPNHIYHELFSAPPPSEAQVAAAYAKESLGDDISPKKRITMEDQTVIITLEGETHEVTVPADETILEAALDADLDAPFACQGGICTTCKAKLLSGKVEMDAHDGLTQGEIDKGYILTCQSHPMTADVKIVYE